MWVRDNILQEIKNIAAIHDVARNYVLSLQDKTFDIKKEDTKHW